MGDAAPLSAFEVGDFIHSVEAFPGQGPVFARSAGTFCQYRGQEVSTSSFTSANNDTTEGTDSTAFSESQLGWAKVRLPSGSVRRISLDARAVFGSVGNQEHNQRNLRKAGRSR